MRIFFTLAIVCFTLPVYSQRFSTLNDGFVAQHWQNKMYYNPAATGYEKKKVINLTGAFYVASQSNTAINYYIAGLLSYEQQVKQSRSSLGIIVNHNQLIYSKYYSAAASYSYALPLGEEKFLRFGAQAGVKAIDFYNPWVTEGSKITVIKDEKPFVNSGVYYNGKTFYAGLAIKSLYGPDFSFVDKNGNSVDFDHKKELNFMVGKTFYSDKTFQLKPSVLIVSDFSKSYLQLNSNFSYKNKYTFGTSMLMSRVNSLGLNAGIKIAEKVEINANYLIPISPKRYFTPGYEGEITGRFLF
ncbi:MAG: PorP/SprF family type IX secretion system membrane protein [Bacteroidia bacterium]